LFAPPQFNTTLDYLKDRLTKEGFGFRTISGSMPLKQRVRSGAAAARLCKHADACSAAYRLQTCYRRLR
jgi:hypothetical protein